VVGGHHPGVGRMELAPPAALGERLPDRVNPLGHDQGGPAHVLGQEIAERPVEAPCQADALAVPGHQGKRAVEVEHPPRVGLEQPLAGLVQVRAPEPLARRIYQINHLRDRISHRAASRAPVLP